MAVKIRFIDTLWRGGTILTPSSENLKHPATDTQIDTKAQFYKASSKTSPCNVPNDLGSAREIDFVAVLDHNFEASGVTIKFEGADDENFAVGLESRTLTYNATDIFAFITSFTKRYVRVRLEKGTDFTDYPQFATVICGKYSEPNYDFLVPYYKSGEDLSTFDYSDSGNLFGQERQILKKWRFSFAGLNDASILNFISLRDNNKTIKAFVVIFDLSSPNSDSHLVRFESLPEMEYIFQERNLELDLIEVK